MACLAATRRNLPLLCRRLQATNFCLTTSRMIDGGPEAHMGSSSMIDGGPEEHSRMFDGGPEAFKGSRRIKGALPRTRDKFREHKFPHRWRFVPRGYDAPPFIHRVKLRLKGLTFSPEPDPDPDVFIIHDGEDGHHYFSAHSVGEDGTIKPKYYLAAPLTLFEPFGSFTRANCNGVFHWHNPDSRAHYLWNPTMNWLKPLPLSPLKMRGISRSNVEDYAIWCYQNECQDYKVLLVVSDHRDDEDFELPFCVPVEVIIPPCVYYEWSGYHLELYSSRTNYWRILDFKTEFYIYPSEGVCLDGVFYWTARYGHEVFLMTFDFATETISTLPLPDELCRYKNTYRIVEFKGLLSVFVSKEHEVIPSTYDHYVMENGVWHANYKFHTVGVLRPVCFSRNGEVLYFESLNDELVMYNLATEEMKRLGVYCSSNPIELYPAS